MLVVFNSFTGKVKRFVNMLGLPIREIEDGLVIDEPFVVVTFPLTAKL